MDAQLTKGQMKALAIFASKNSTRFAIDHARFAKGKAVAADGHKLLVLDVPDIDESEEAVYVPYQSLETAAKATKKSETATLAVDHIQAPGVRVTGPNNGEGIGVFPPYEQVLPKEEPTLSIGLGVGHLEDCIKAFKAMGVKTVRFDLFGPKQAIRMAPFGAGADARFTSVLMPVNLGEAVE